MAGKDKLVSPDAPGLPPDPAPVGPTPTNLSSAFGNFAQGNVATTPPAVPATGIAAGPAPAPVALGGETPLTPNFIPDLPPGASNQTDASSSTAKLRPEDAAAVNAAGHTYTGALQQGVDVVAQRAKEQADTLAQTAARVKAHADEDARLHALDEQHNAELMARREKSEQDYLAATRDKSLGTALNPTTGQKVASIFALLLSGAGSGVTHTPNAAAAMLESEYQHAWQKRNDRLNSLKDVRDDTDRLIMRNRELYKDRDQARAADLIAIRNQGIDRLNQTAKLYEGPEAAARASELSALTDLKNKQEVANLQARRSSATTHVASAVQVLEDQQKLALGNAQLYQLAQNGGIKPEQLDKIDQELDKRGIREGNNAYMQAYRASDGLTKIPGMVSRVFAQWGAGVKPGASPSETISNLAASFTSNLGTNDKERQFVGALQILTRAMAKRMEGGRMSDQDAVAYNAAAGLGPNASQEQIRQVLVSMNNANRAAEGDVFAAHGGQAAADIWRRNKASMGQSSGLAMDQPTAPADKPITGLTPGAN